MPIFEGKCQNCNDDRVYEFFLSNYTKPSKPCPNCHNELTRLISKSAVVWAKPLGWYGGGNELGHMVYERDEFGKTHKRYITTRKEQLDYCKKNGLKDPLEIDQSAILDDRGKSEQTNKTVSWI